MNDKAQIKAEIHAAGLRATAPRVAVLELLRGSERPLSHAEVVETLGETDWDQATLFRNLVKLAESGFARVASHAGGVARYEASTPGGEPHVHPHFACRECKVVSCLHDARLHLPEDAAWREALAAADLQLTGTCPSCRRAAACVRP